MKCIRCDRKRPDVDESGWSCVMLPERPRIQYHWCPACAALSLPRDLEGMFLVTRRVLAGAIERVINKAVSKVRRPN